MKLINSTLGLAAASLFACSALLADGTYPAVGEVKRFSPLMDELLTKDAVIERLTEDTFTWSEGPVWVPDGDYVVFSDVPEDTAWKWSEQGGLAVFLNPSSLDDGRVRDPKGEGSNGLMLSLEGKILAGDHGSRSLIEIDLETMKKKMLVGEYDGKRFSSPNDLVISRVRWPGTVFFTDPPYGLTDDDKSELKEIDFNGVYRFDASGLVTLLDDSLGRPNGIALSPDEKTLYVANSQKERSVWMAYDLDEQGAVIGVPRVFSSAQHWADENAKGLPDGMAVDVEGNLWATGPGGVLVIDPTGEILGLIETGTAAANCAFGGKDGSELYITAHKFLARIQTRTRGIEFR